MPPDVLLRKLTYLRQLLADLAPYRYVALEEIVAEHYKVERLLELLVMVASDILFHKLAQHGRTPVSYRDAFRMAGEAGLVPTELAASLQEAAGMRSILVHLYERIDYALLQAAIEPALRDFGQLVIIFETELDVEE